MKRCGEWFGIILCLLFCFGGYGANVNEDGFTVSKNNVQDAEPDIIAWLGDLGYANNSSDTQPETTESTGSKALVVYYSATGNTEEAANYIAGAMEADLFELKPTRKYSDADLDWTDSDSRVSREHDNPEERKVTLVADTVENWDSYDTVFIGYPIWWGIAAWPVDGFIAANNFTGKTVIPFCTSSSSGLGESCSKKRQKPVSGWKASGFVPGLPKKS